LTLLDTTYPSRQITRISVAVENDCIHKAPAVEQWLASRPRFEVLWLPTYCPRANPIEKEFIEGKTRGLPKARFSVARKSVNDFKKLTNEPEPIADILYRTLL
jgi:transposase